MSINEPFSLTLIFALQDGETTLHLTVRYLTVAIALEIIDEMKRVMDQEEFVKAINTRNRVHVAYTAQKMKFFVKDFFSKCDQLRRKLRIWSHLLKISLMESFFFCVQC